MHTVLYKLFLDVGIDPDSEPSRMYLEMEKNQIMDAWEDGSDDCGSERQALDYYLNTYGKE